MAPDTVQAKAVMATVLAEGIETAAMGMVPVKEMRIAVGDTGPGTGVEITGMPRKTEPVTAR
jgi:hypothetical protein